MILQNVEHAWWYIHEALNYLKQTISRINGVYRGYLSPQTSPLSSMNPDLHPKICNRLMKFLCQPQLFAVTIANITLKNTEQKGWLTKLQKFDLVMQSKVSGAVFMQKSFGSVQGISTPVGLQLGWLEWCGARGLRMSYFTRLLWEITELTSL